MKHVNIKISEILTKCIQSNNIKIKDIEYDFCMILSRSLILSYNDLYNKIQYITYDYESVMLEFYKKIGNYYYEIR